MRAGRMGAGVGKACGTRWGGTGGLILRAVGDPKGFQGRVACSGLDSKILPPAAGWGTEERGTGRDKMRPVRKLLPSPSTGMVVAGTRSSP